MRLVLGLLLAVLCSAQTIKTSRPRLMVDSTRVSELIAKRTSTAANIAAWAKMQTRYYAYRDTVTDPSQWGDAIALFALVAPEEGPTGFTRNNAQRACDVLEYNINYGYLKTPATGNNLRWYWLRALLLYDWAYDYCSAGQLTAIEAKLDAEADLVLASSYYNGLPNNTSGNTTMSAFNYMVWYSIVRGDSAKLASVITNKLTPRVIPAFADSLADAVHKSSYGGFVYEGSEYSPEALLFLHNMAEAIRLGTTDTDIWPSLLPVVENYADMMIANTEPKPSFQRDGRDVYGPWPVRDQDVYIIGTTGVYSQGWRSHLWYDRNGMNAFRYQAERLSYTSIAARAQWWINNIRPCGFWGVSPTTTCYDERVMFYEWMFGDLGAATETPSATSWVGPMWLLAKSAVPDQNATWAGIWGGATTIASYGHIAGDNGNVQIYRNGEWLTQKVMGYAGSSYPSRENLIYGKSHNVAVLNYHDAFPESADMAFPGLGRFTRTPAGGYKARCTTDYCYGQVEGNQYKWTAYQTTPDVADYYREFLFIKPDVTVVADRVKYVAGLNGHTIVYWHDGALGSSVPTLDGARATLATGTQRLHVTTIGSTTPSLAVRQHGGMRIAGARKVSDDSVVVYLDGARHVLTGGRITISGITGGWADLNGTWTVAADSRTITSPYSDGALYWVRRLRITSTGAFTNISSTWDHTQTNANVVSFPWTVSSVTLPSTTTARIYVSEDPKFFISLSIVGISLTGATGSYAVLNGRQCSLTGYSSTEGYLTCSYGLSHGLSGTVTGAVGVQTIANTPLNGTYYTPYRLEATLAPSNEHALLFVLEGADSTDTPADVTSRSGTRTVAASFTKSGAAYVVATPSTTSITLPLTYTVPSGNATNYVTGLSPSTTYDVSVADNTVTIAASGSGSDIATSSEGVLVFNSNGVLVPLQIDAPTTLPSGTELTTYTTTTVTISGGTAPYTCTWTGLPSGMSGNCTSLSGTPADGSAGSYTPHLEVADSASPAASTSRDYSLSIADLPSPLTVTPETLPACQYGQVYSQQLSASGGTGGPYTWDVLSGSLPTGLTLSSGGLISGTCTGVGDFSFAARADDGSVTGTRSYSVTTSPLAGAIKLRSVRPATTAVLVSGGASIVPWGQTCTATALLTSDKSVVDTDTVATGAQMRDYTLSGLTASTLYDISITCGSYKSTTQTVSTLAVLAGTGSISRVVSSPPSPATHAKIEYGTTSSLGSETANKSCSSGCSFTITGLTRGSPLFSRTVWTNSEGASIRSTSITSIVVR